MRAPLIVRRIRCGLAGHDMLFGLLVCARCDCTAEMIRRGLSRRAAEQEEAFWRSGLDYRHGRERWWREWSAQLERGMLDRTYVRMWLTDPSALIKVSGVT